MAYVDLSRRFRDLTEAELEAPELLAYLSDSSLLPADGWAELIEHPRVVLLAEAGSGKTAEMREQAARLMADGKPAFFVALESLAHEPLADLLSPAEERSLDAWKKENRETAWFFLDAVDELKLTGGKLERALQRLARALDGLLHRVRIVISCRPYDWRPSLDMAIVQSRLPIVPTQPVAVPATDDPFLTALRERQSGRKVAENKARREEVPRVVILLPLSARQIEILARSLGIADTAAFITEIGRRDAWTFARRPLDLLELATSWKTTGRLGTRSEQHAANVSAKLKDDPDRADRGLLSDERARGGAERLALALVLARARTIRSPEQASGSERTESVLDAAEILMDWTEEERQTLLRRGLFDPATYGRVRFHHRSVQEYLAARRLLALREKGMSAKSFCRLLFAELYGVPLVIPSMRAIAAWLALWDADVRRELMVREPETLLSMGDPETLPIDARAQLLRAFAGAYGEGGWRGLSIPLDEVRRLAHSELAEVVRELWAAKPSSPDVSELLLEMIWQGKMEGCAGIARSVVFDVDLSDILRVTALRALAACGKTEILQEVADSILREPARWPDRVVYTGVEDLFPIALSVPELVVLMERMHEPRNTVGGFSWAMRQIVEAIEPSSDLAIELRDTLANQIWQGRQEEQDWYPLRGKFDYLAPALARLCARQLVAKPPTSTPDTGLLRACVIANRFGDGDGISRDLIGDLRKHFESSNVLRESAFWNEVILTSEAMPTENSKERLFRAEHKSLLGQITTSDRPWLLEAVRSKRGSERLFVLHALLQLWGWQGRQEGELDDLIAAVQDDADFIEVLRKESALPGPDETLERWRRKERRLKLVREGRERQRLEKWASWRKQLLADPEAAFSDEQLPATRRTLYTWLDARQEGRNHHSAWDGIALQQAFGNEVATQAAEAFKAVWRAHPPILRSQRAAGERNSILWVWAEGLTGLAAEATTPGWAAHLTAGEARIAAAYATVELNEFPSWLRDVAAAHPIAIDEAMGGELVAEVAMIREDSHAHILQNLFYSDSSIKRLLAPRLFIALSNWPSIFPDDESSRRSAHELGQVLGILDDVIEGEDRATVARLCAQRFSNEPIGPLAAVWLEGLFRIDPEAATLALEESLTALQRHERQSCALETFASLFGDRGKALAFPNQEKRAASLGRLVRLAYYHVRPGEDQDHEDVYTPDLRDRAERARNFLLSALLDTPGAAAQQVIRDLAADPLFADFPDRLRFLARQRAAADAEGPPLTSAEVVALEGRFEAPPHDRDTLFTVVLDRLDDLAHDIAHDDFTDRRTLRTIKDEAEMQRTLARRLQDAAKGAYIVSREEEVADLKKTDIRLAAPRGNHKAVIEVKIADKRWSLTQLEAALGAQLVGRYLRHAACKAGCLLLTYDGTKKYWKDPKTRRRLSFAEMVEYLRCSAQAQEQELGYEVRLAIFPLDLTDPPPEDSAADSTGGSSNSSAGPPRRRRVRR